MSTEAVGALKDISIHALREESDMSTEAVGALKDISIHALREESDILKLCKRLCLLSFQSTLSARRATI